MLGIGSDGDFRNGIAAEKAVLMEKARSARQVLMIDGILICVGVCGGVWVCVSCVPVDDWTGREIKE